MKSCWLSCNAFVLIILLNSLLFEGCKAFLVEVAFINVAVVGSPDRVVYGIALLLLLPLLLLLYVSSDEVTMSLIVLL